MNDIIFFSIILSFHNFHIFSKDSLRAELKLLQLSFTVTLPFERIVAVVIPFLKELTNQGFTYKLQENAPELDVTSSASDDEDN